MALKTFDWGSLEGLTPGEIRTAMNEALGVALTDKLFSLTYTDFPDLKVMDHIFAQNAAGLEGVPINLLPWFTPDNSSFITSMQRLVDALPDPPPLSDEPVDGMSGGDTVEEVILDNQQETLYNLTAHFMAGFCGVPESPTPANLIG